MGWQDDDPHAARLPASFRRACVGLRMDIRNKSVEIRGRVGNLLGEFALEDKMTGQELFRFFARLRNVKDLGYAHELANRLGAI
jgi:ABC-type multidrug transport system ATPase subunit